MQAFEKLQSFWPLVRRRAALEIGAAAASGSVDEKLAVETLIAVLECKPGILEIHHCRLRDQLAAIQGLAKTRSNEALDYLLRLRKNVRIEIGEWEDVGNTMHEIEPGKLYSKHACFARLEFPNAKGPLKKALDKKKRFVYYMFQGTTAYLDSRINRIFIPNKPNRKPGITESSFTRSRALRLLDKAIEELGLPPAQRELLTIHEETVKGMNIPAEWKTTPYDGIVMPDSSVKPPYPRQEKMFDFFVSYKSEDVEIARLISQQLIAAGFTAWFAEYIVHLKNRQQFMEAINQGLRHSTYGILLTGEPYLQSRYCRYEAEQLIRPGNCGANRVVNIKLRPEPRLLEMFPPLKQCPMLEYTGNINDVLKSIGQLVTFPAGLQLIPGGGKGEPVVFRDKHLGYTLDIAGWQLNRSGGEKTIYGTTGPECVKNFGAYKAHWNLIVGSPAPAPRQIPRLGQAIDDRECYNQLMDAARTMLGRFKADCKGVHLMFSAGYSQLGLTYWFHGYWTRRYSVVLIDPHTGVPTEFAFVFAFFGPFREYCRHVHVMDRVVRSLKWK